jgi:6-pyruvoyltetrahydropterin/6-carboxytetrahydropterin synthase
VRDDRELEFRVCGARYVLPREDALLLPIDNVSAEALAAYLAERLVAAMGDELTSGVVTGVEVAVHESPGQGSSCHVSLA